MSADFPPEFKKMLGEASEGSAKKIAESGSFLAIFTSNFKESAVPLLQLGIAIMMDKPIILLIPKEHWGIKIPIHLEKIASLIRRVDFDNEAEMAIVRRQIVEITEQGEL